MAVWLLLLLGVVSLLYYYVRRRYSYWTDKGIPHLEPTLPLGNLKGVGSTRSFAELLDEAYGRYLGKSPVIGMYFLASPILVVTDLDLAKQILVKDFHRFHDRGMYVNERDDPLSGHLFSIGGERWRYLRNKLSPTFTSGKIKSMFTTIREIGDEFLAAFDKYIDRDEPIDIKLLCQCFTCDVVGSCAFGLQCNSLKNEGSKLLEIGDKVFRQNPLRMIYSVAVGIFPRISRALRLPVLPGEVSSFFMPVVRSTVEHRERNAIERPDFLNLLIQLKNKGTVEEHEAAEGLEKLTLDEVAAQAFVFFFAGFETSSTTLSFALFELANNPAIQERVRAEVLEKLKLHDGQITYDALKEMTYLDQVINETLRMYPPVPQLIRVSTQPYSVEAANVTLDRDTMLMVPIYAIHHDATLYPDPERFDPDRFAPDAVHSRHTHAFLPFGDGPRNCIGMRFGLLEVKFGIVQMISKLQFTVSSRMQLPIRMSKSASILEAEGGIWLNATKL
ncbi:probable cytochrome P450 6a14 isoform X2 [Anopheles stephensi]|uniref:probable cytochrome P450 6a14 isoform X2 n=1 Tax=Anopheles stephensi TaxID=30069 RepID=UPI0016589610|nr:probable cytochrome P450 6a14 isoform X2 [Anopheles stephensi]